MLDYWETHSTQKNAIFDMSDSDLNDFWCISRPMCTQFKNVRKSFFDPPEKF